MQTSPHTTSEIDTAFGDGAPLIPSRDDSLRGEWRRIGAFLKRPSLEVDGLMIPAWKRLVRIYALDVVAMAVLITAATLLTVAGIELPRTALADMEITALIVFGVVVFAPLSEELGFRSWLSGKAGHVLGVVAIGLGGLGFWLMKDSIPLGAAGAGLAGIIIAAAALFFLRGRPPMRWFAWAFPGFFWFATLAFALIHFGNFEIGEGVMGLLVLLPLVLPQFILGALLGYVRVQIGLWAAIALHAAHNASALLVVFATGGFSGA